MSKAFKAFFLGRQLREKLLLVVFVVAGVAIWLSSFSGRARRFWQEAQSTNATLATQAAWLSRSDSIAARSNAAVSKLDPLKTYNANRLLGMIDRLAKEEFGNKVVVTTEAPKSSGQFTINSVTATITATNTEADWKLLRDKFYPDLQKLSPYISLEELTIATGAAGRSSAGGSMTVRMRATSIEVAAR